MAWGTIQSYWLFQHYVRQGTLVMHLWCPSECWWSLIGREDLCLEWACCHHLTWVAMCAAFVYDCVCALVCTYLVVLCASNCLTDVNNVKYSIMNNEGELPMRVLHPYNRGYALELNTFPNVRKLVELVQKCLFFPSNLQCKQRAIYKVCYTSFATHQRHIMQGSMEDSNFKKWNWKHFNADQMI